MRIGMAHNFRQLVGDLATSERGGLQRSIPVGRCYPARRSGNCLLLESRRLRPLELCMFVIGYMFCFITLMKLGGSIQGTPFAFFKKIKKCRKVTKLRRPSRVFYSEFWGLVSFDVMVMIEEFQYRTGDMTKINKSHLFLLLKRQGAYRVENFHSISLSNSIYLIIAKVLGN